MPLAVIVAVVAASVLAGSAWAGGNAGFGPVDPASPTTERVSHAYWLIAALSVGILVLIMVPLLLFAARYRSRGRPRSVEGPQVHGNTGFELAWTALPVVLLVAVASFVFYKLPGITDPAAAGEPLRVRVEGRQFYWRYVYENGVVAVDTLRVPVGRVIELDMTAPENDVIHSYWVPALFPKRDTIPGQTTTQRFVAERAGLFEGQCGEFCGVQHAAMTAFAEAMPPERFDGWLEEQARLQERGGRELGEALWEGACMKCHRLDEAYVGPALRGNPTLADRASLEQIVRFGRRAMPAVGQGWTEREIDALFAWTRQYGGGEDDTPATDGDSEETGTETGDGS
jgi:cytochrome c oxidase subunit 2